MGTRFYLIFLNLSFLLLCSVFLSVHQKQSSSVVLVPSLSSSPTGSSDGCRDLQNLDGNRARCLYLRSNERNCVSQAYINYLYIFYCDFGEIPFLGYSVLFLWLLVLFYVLGNTASEYFCSSLEGLSRFLNLSPAIAGVTLLSLGNGAPDFFASIVSFTGNGTQNVGLNTVLGGASFVSCVVVAAISFLVQGRNTVDKSAFVRDVLFLMLVLLFLLFVLLNGEINVWVAMAFSSMYAVYVAIVYISHNHWGSGGGAVPTDGDNDLTVPILDGTEKEIECGNCVELEIQKCSTPAAPLSACDWFLFVVQFPLYFPRRLTIPVIADEKWSKPYAVASATLAPPLLSALWNFNSEESAIDTNLLFHVIGGIVGFLLGVMSYLTTERSDPPKKCLLPWLMGGFLMSVAWSYITAQELVGLLVSIGYILNISPSILGLTVLAWGNSIGDLMTNSTIAMYGGPDGTQVALSGCYAGPIFNTLFGLGMSLIGAAWYQYPSPLVIPKDTRLIETLGFLMAGLVWALVVLPRRGMKVDRVLGGGLLAIYTVSLSLRLIQTLGYL